MQIAVKRISDDLRSSLLLQVISLALVYALLGRLSLLLAIPPGYAVAIFPPAGIALGVILTRGYRLLPGVALGSLMVNLFVAWEPAHQITSNNLLLAVILASGACLQAFVSSYLVHQKLKTQLQRNTGLALDTDKDIFYFFIMGALLGCMVSATWGTVSLYLFGIISLADISSHWLTWWIGDTLGVLITTPLVLILVARPRDIWQFRRYSVMLPLVICLITVVIAFVFIRNREDQKQRLEFRLEAERISQKLQNNLNAHADAVKDLERLYSASEKVSRTEFHIFTEHPLTTLKEITDLLWVPRVLRADKTKFEESVLREGFISFQITEKNSNGKTVPAEDREDYFPITYIEPFENGKRVFGFDMGSTAIRRNAIEEARDSGKLAVTDPLVLLSGDDKYFSVLLYAPIYARGKSVTNIQERRDAFRGTAVSVVRIKNLVGDLLNEEKKANLLLEFYDLSYPGSNGVFYDSIKVIDAAHVFQSTIDFGSRQYAFLAQPSATYWAAHTSWITWFTKFGSLLFSTLLAVYVLVATAHTFNVEKLVAQRTSQLHESEARLRAILANAAEGIITTDAHGLITSANQSAEILLDYSTGALFGRNILELFPEIESATFLAAYLNDHIESDMTGDNTISTATAARKEVVAKKRTHEGIPLELAMAKVALGTQNLVVLILHDLSERKRIEKLKSEFVSSVSHELRTPLTSIRGALGLLAGGVGGGLSDQAKTLVTMANNNASRLTLLINDLLDFEKLEYGGIQFNIEKIILRDLVKQSIEANQGYAQNFSIKMQFFYEASPTSMVSVDTQRLMQVLSNLLSNAIKFSQQNGVVEIHIRQIADWVRLEVVDFGIGISADFQKNIFQKFSQEDAKATRKYAGTGLGLSLSKSMIEKMSGKIGFCSVEGHGSTFYVELPLAS